MTDSDSDFAIVLARGIFALDSFYLSVFPGMENFYFPVISRHFRSLSEL